LYLLRHAKSDWGDPSAPDHDRPLAPRGRRACKRLAAYIEREGIAPKLVLCSTALRARQTLDGVSEALGEPPVVIDERLYLAAGEQLLERIAEVPASAGSLMLVGHNPGVSQLVRMLTDYSPAAPPEIPTGALATLDFDVADWAAVAVGEVVAYVTPRELPDP
jgi:phosphohistidine phosphatase